MFGFFFHFVVDALVQLAVALIFLQPRMPEVLIASAQLAAQQLVQVVDYGRMPLHGVYLDDLGLLE